jgi:hypothetical protein
MDEWQKPEKVTWQQVAEQRMNFIPDQCPVCKEGILMVIVVIDPQRGPPVRQSRLTDFGYAD